jgi:hypothetical protein
MQWRVSADALTRRLQLWSSARCETGSSITGLTLCMAEQHDGAPQPALLMACSK